MKFEVKIGTVQHRGWGMYEGNNAIEVANNVKNQIENLAPLNSTPEGAEAYRNRFRGLPILIRESHSKEWQTF